MQDTPYAAVRVDDDGAGGGAPRGFVLQLISAGPRGGDAGDDDPAAARLEVVRQGEWLGFRSAAAGGRFLQVRTCATGRLCLHTCS